MAFSSHRRLSVLHVTTATSGGVAEAVLGHVRDQVERGWHVTVACPTDGALGYDARVAGARVRWWSTTAAGARGPGPSVLPDVSTLRSVVDAANPDLVHLHGAGAGLAGRLVLRNKLPTVMQPHGWTFLGCSGGVRATSWRWERFASRWTTELVCVSDGERWTGEEHGVSAPTTVLPLGVDLDRFPAQGDTERRAARRDLGLRAAPTVLCVGRLALQKGQQDLLTDWPSVRAQVPDAELLLVGDGPDRDGLVRLASRLQGVGMPGWRSDVGRWYAAADVVAVPSRWEGMSLVPLEAMASSRSVVATDVAGMAETIPSTAGAVVPAHDGPALVDALVRRLREPGTVEDEGWSGRTHVELHHDAAAAARDLARIYLRLVAARR